MKRYFFLAFLIACAAYCSAQIVCVHPAPKVRWGIRAAFDVNIPGGYHNLDTNDDVFKCGVGVTLGPVCDINLGHSFKLQTGAMIYYDAYSYNKFVVVDENANPIKKDPGLYKVGFRIPVMIGYTAGINDRLSLTISTGPELGYAFAGKVRVPKTFIDADESLDLYGPVGMKRLDCAWKIGFSMPFNRTCVGVEAAFGMLDLIKQTGKSFYENRVSFSVAQYF